MLGFRFIVTVASKAVIGRFAAGSVFVKPVCRIRNAHFEVKAIYVPVSIGVLVLCANRTDTCPDRKHIDV